MRKYAFIVVTVAILGFTGQTLLANELTIGVANDSNCVPFGCAGSANVTEYQQIYSPDQFNTYYPPGFTIAAVSFFASDPNPAVTSGNYTISFSTTTSASVGSLNADLTQNSASNQSFFSGALPLGALVGSELTIGGNGPTPTYFYDPSMGNLLMDITISSPGLDSGTYFYTEKFGSSTSRVTNAFVDAVNIGLVTKFSDVPPPVATVTPEPGSMLLFGTGLLALAKATRRRRQGDLAVPQSIEN
jgi:hypothetical protein